MRNNELNLPKEALVNKFIAKSKFYEKSTINTKLQKEFVDSILKITWKYKLAESTIGLAKTDTVTEIQIFEVELKKMVLPLKVLKIIDKSIPYQILYRFLFNGNVSWGITLKEKTTVENYYFSQWNEEITFDFTGINLEKVYQKIVKSFIDHKTSDESTFKNIVDTDRKIKALENEILLLESKIKKEKHLNRKVEINKVLLEKKDQLKEIKCQR
jgi:hypothetical protein